MTSSAPPAPDESIAVGSTEHAVGGRRRYLTLLFADMSDSTILSDQMEAEDYAALLGKLRDLCREIVGRHGGQIARIQGDGLLAFFGWPEAQEDDGKRATAAALELHSAVVRLSTGLRLPGGRALRFHSGIHGGLVLASEGDVERGRFELLGNVPNIAAHLSNVADADGILVSEGTLGPHRRFFTTSERQTIHLAKLDAPLVVFRVLGRAATRDAWATHLRLDLTPFVGREPELRVLLEQLRLSLAGSNVCCVVSAPAGMGKSRLIEELVQRASDERICTLRGFAEDHLGAVPLQPFMMALSGLASMGQSQGLAIDSGLAERARLLLSGGPDLQGQAGLRSTVELLRDLATAQPVLLVLDDWQWADEASQKVLEGLRTNEQGLMVLLGTRLPVKELLLARPAQTLALEPLDSAAASRLTEFLVPGADPFVVGDIHRYAGGNPLYLEELCHAAQVPGSSWRNGIKLAGSAWLSGLIESRVGRLPPAHAKVVRAAAVLGNVFPSWLLERMTGYGPDHALVRALTEADLVYPGEQASTLRFKHGITRDVIYGTVGLHQRQRLHLQTAEALMADDSEGDQHVEALAYHFAAGRKFESAALYAERAGDKAMAASAVDRARSQYTAVLAAMDEMAPLSTEMQLRWCAVAEKLATACVFDPLSLANVGLFERALAFARQTERVDVIARAEYWLGYVLYAKGLSLQAAPHCEAALALALGSGEERFAAQVRAVYGQVLLSAGDYERASNLLDEALEVRSQIVHSSKRIAVGAAYTLACKGYLLGDRGDFTRSHECFDEALRLIGDARHQVASSVRHWRCVVLQWQGRWEDALRMADDSADIAEHTRSRQQLLMGRAMAGYIRWVVSRRSEELQALRDATSWIEARDGRLAMSLNHGWLVEAALAEGAEEEARYHAARLLLRSRQADRLGEALGCRALALAAAKLNQFGRAERYLAMANDSATARGSAHERACNYLCEAQIRLGRGNDARVVVLLNQALEAFDSMSMTWHLERARRLSLQARQ